jgi:hypothetical protein
MLEPISTKPRTEVLEPERENALSDMELPNANASSTDNLDPMRAKERREILDPADMNCITDTLDPQRENPRIDKLDPNVNLSIIEIL